MIIIATNKENCIKEFENELKRNPDQKTFTIYVDDGLDKSIIINNDYIVKRTYLTNKNNALETLIKAFEILPVDMLYHGITLKFDETKEGKEEMKNERKTILIPTGITKRDENKINRILGDNETLFTVVFKNENAVIIDADKKLFEELSPIIKKFGFTTIQDKIKGEWDVITISFDEMIARDKNMVNRILQENYKHYIMLDDNVYYASQYLIDELKPYINNKSNDYYELELSDIIVTDDDMEEFAGEVAKIYKNDIAGYMGMYGIVPGLDYSSAITSASAYGFNYAVNLIMNRLFEKAKKPEEKKPNKLTNENKKKLLKMLDCVSSDVIHPTPEELENEKVNLTYGELAELIEELFSVG